MSSKRCSNWHGAAPTNALGEATVYEYNLQGRKTYEGGGTYPVRFTYDTEGRMTGMITYRDESGPGDTTDWNYDPATGLLIQKLYEDGMGPSYTYTPDGKLATRTWARGVATEYAYDGWGNLTNVVHSDGTPSISMAYDAMGRLIETTDAAGVTTFAYDAFSSLTNETVSGQYAKALDRQIDGYGRNVGYSLDGQRKQTVAYDPATGRIASMDGFVWQYLPGTDLKRSLAYPNGAVAEWVYESRRDLLTLVSNDVFSAYAYENDAAGRRISKNTERYGYNVRGELIAATNIATAAHYAYTFDSIGNRVVADELGTNTAYSANALNQYTNIVAEAPFAPEFDDDGNQTRVKTSTGIWHVAYNAENRPVVWSNETAVVTMDFDRMGRRVWYKSISGAQTNAYAKFVYDGYLCVQQLDGLTGNVEQEFVWDPTETVATRPLKWTLPGLGRTFFYFHDGNKNVTDVVDAADSTLAAHYDYAPFGAVTVATGPMADANPYRFSSEYHDPALGCVYYNFRHYNPLDGKWLNRDLLQERGGINLSVFLNNSPMFRYDFLGLSILDTIIDKLNCWLNPGKLEYVSHSFSPPTGEEFEYARKTSIGLILIGSNPYGVGMDSTIYLPFHIYDWGGATDGSAKVKNRVTCRKRCQCVAKCKSECCGDYEKKIKDIYIYGRVFSRWLGGPWSPAQYALAWPDIPEKQLWADGYCELYAGGEENAKRECERMAKEKCNSL